MDQAAGLSEARLRAVWDSAGDAMALSDPAGIVLDVNPAYEDLYGYPRAEVVGRSFALIFPEAAREWAHAEYHRRFTDPHIAPPVRTAIRRDDGSERTVEARYNFLTEAGHRVAMLSVVRDVTAQVQAEAALQASHTHFALIAHTAGELLLTENPDTYLPGLLHQISARLGLELYLQYCVDDDRDALRLESSGGVPADVAASLRWLPIGEAVCGTVAQQRTPIVVADVQRSTDPLTARLRSLGVTAYACHPLVAYGRLVGTLSFGTRTRPHLSPEELYVLQTVSDQVAMALERARLLASERAARADAEAALRLRSALLAGITHDLRTPLSTIKALAQLLGRRREQAAAPPVMPPAEGFRRIESAANQIEAMLSELFDIASISNGRPLDLHRQPTDLVALARRQVDAHQQTAPRHQLQVITAESSLVGQWDSLRLTRVIDNLLSNAVKYSPAGGAVTVAIALEQPDAPATDTTPGRPWARLTVQDEGMGIPTADLPHIFTLFFRATNAAGDIAGTGIGLAGVKQIIEQHGGTVTVTSEEGQGATITCRLPLA